MAYEQNRLDDYVDVAERIRIFRERFPEGTLQPLDPSAPFHIVEVAGQTFIQYTAVAYRSPNDQLPGIAVSWEPFPGKTPYTAGSELMNAETAAWGRAIIAALVADSKKIASLDEVRARRQPENLGHPSTDERQAPQRPLTQSTDTPATEAQERALYAISKKLEKLPPAKGSLSKSAAGKMIETLQAELEAKNNDTEEPF
ncbi:hypothetical protein UFOVP433_9 [uncultured Caudovirales phage]|uniref:Uncharacterized protein n=1 Tax=uncultured Caudovirales phage TaxID=2100421 RepID=A0A6J5NM23_9CAUD|nr:hypothetical protein UFOVP433_9 [uncultured Caudovirales phage]CAB4158461.1 hypothetical protein UFOVP702_12 [uncultured Caudovirales phage]